MSGFGQKAVERWNDWQLIVLVLLSLSVQLLLVGTAGFRKRTRPRVWSKVYFWTLHVGSRYVATYPLGILSRASTNNPNADIQAFWAALLLFHLGRPDDFTALVLEDNAIWPRQCFELSVQAVITAYVFSRYCVDQDFKRFILPFLLISFAGLLKCGEQVYALKHATMEELIRSVLGTPDAGPDYADTMDRVDGMLRSGVLPSINIDSKRLPRLNSDAPETGDTRANQNTEPQLAVDISVADAQVADETGADQNIEQNRAVINSVADAGDAGETRAKQFNLNIVSSAYSLFSRFKVLFADGLFSFEDRRESQALFSGKDAKWAFKVIEIELSFVYDRLYTKASVSRSNTGKAIRLTSLLLIFAGSLYTFFATVHATQYLRRHRYVTYTLLAGALGTEVVILARYMYSIWSLAGNAWLNCWSVNLVQNRSRWSGYMAQSNLITFCLVNLPSDGWLDSLVVQFYRPSSRGRPDIPSRFVAEIFAFSKSILCYASLIQGGSLQAQANEAVRAAVSQYLQRPSVLDQLQSKGFWNKFDKRKYTPVRDDLKDFIFRQVKEKEGILIAREESYQTTGIPDCCKPFIDCRGDWVLEKEEEYGRLGWSFQGKEFDESLLLWHIATDLCFRRDVNQGNNSTRQQVNSGNGSTDQETKGHMKNGREISNYLLYIMVVHPLMLSSSTTMATKRCRDTCAEARRHILKEHIQSKFSSSNVGGSISEKNAHASLLKVDTKQRASAVKGDKSKSVLWDGCFLAKQLNQIEDGKKWLVISRVWVEMLCYAAVQCGGYQHALRLKEGGELITFVCLLMTHLGMGKHYRTEIGDTYAHLSPFRAQSASRPAPPAQAEGVQENATISRDEASTSGHGKQAATVSIDEASTSGHGHQ
ncbi:hypothetical protein QYE76_035433 [Lolium multiflorum]|uniref:DUF4220 domain-containing protein n=1 Tax=Lolium multiflorum TaxID=4521 RepID=A0AAD8QZ07_LOLMU|nr:hypothetical protein QYE76_035433 [Lolium multiflorum]